MNDSARWNRRLTPPPGGMERLMRALAEPQRSRRPWVLTFAAACSACLAFWLGIYIHAAPQRAFEQSLREALAQSVAADEGVMPLQELPSSRPDVRIVLVAFQPVPPGGVVD